MPAPFRTHSLAVSDRSLAAMSAALTLALAGCAGLADRGSSHDDDLDITLGAPPPDDGRLRIIAFGAHPDDCEIKAGGVAAKWAAAGHHVKFVAVTNGDIGHWRERGATLAARRLVEVRAAAELLGIETQVLAVHDGELAPTLALRRAVVRLIRHWNADIVLSHRPNDYHPDHRYTGVLVQDAAYMVTVPFFCPDTPHLPQNPAFLYFEDRFREPSSFDADVVVPIDDVVETKLRALGIMVSQFFEGGANGHEGLLPADEAGVRAREEQVRQAFAARFAATAERFRAHLKATLGDEAGARVEHAEAFALCEYGRQPTKEELAKLFPSGP